MAKPRPPRNQADTPQDPGSKRRLLIGFALAILALLAALSLWQGWLNAWHGSQDFQWSPAQAFWRRENPYELYLEGNRGNQIILNQIPNYAQTLYIFLAPYALLPFAAAKPLWAASNILFAIISCTLSARAFALTRLQCWLLMLLFLMAFPTRNSIGNGQQSLLILTAFTLAITLADRRSIQGQQTRKASSKKPALLAAILAGFSYIKYSFAPSFGAAFLHRLGRRFFLITLVPTLAGLVFFSAWLGRLPPTLTTIFEPLKVASNGIGSGYGDLLSILQLLLPSNSIHLKAASLLCLLLAGAAPFLMDKRSSDLTFWSFAAVASLSFVTHLVYDYVFYLFPAIFALRHWRHPRGQAIGALVLYQWFAVKAIASAEIANSALPWLGFMANLLTLHLLRSHAAEEKLQALLAGLRPAKSASPLTSAPPIPHKGSLD